MRTLGVIFWDWRWMAFIATVVFDFVPLNTLAKEPDPRVWVMLYPAISWNEPNAF